MNDYAISMYEIRRNPFNQSKKYFHDTNNIALIDTKNQVIDKGIDAIDFC